MVTAAMIIVLMLVLLAVSLRSKLLSGRKQYALLFILSYIICIIIIMLNSFDINVYGPSRLVMDIARALGLI